MFTFQRCVRTETGQPPLSSAKNGKRGERMNASTRSFFLAVVYTLVPPLHPLHASLSPPAITSHVFLLVSRVLRLLFIRERSQLYCRSLSPPLRSEPYWKHSLKPQQRGREGGRESVASRHCLHTHKEGKSIPSTVDEAGACGRTWRVYLA